MKRMWQNKIGALMNAQQVSRMMEDSPYQLDDGEDEESEDEDYIPRRYSFETIKEKKIREFKKEGLNREMAEEEIDIKDIVEMDDDDIANSVKDMVAQVLDSVYFKGLIFIVIVLNAVHIALQTVQTISIPYSNFFSFVDNAIMGIFICEIILKWYSGFFLFWKDYWNILDFVIIFVLHLGPWLAFFSNTRLLRILRVIRAFRSLKTVTSLTGLSLVVETILQSIPDMANIMMLMFIFTMVLSVVGVKLFSKFVPQFFGTTLDCMFSIFVCFTQDGWKQIYDYFERYAEVDRFTYISASLFFVLTILMAAFIIANLIVAVVTTNLDKAMKEMKEERKHNLSTLSTSTKDKNEEIEKAAETNNEDDSHDVSLVYVEEVLEIAAHADSKLEARSAQRALYKSDLSRITSEKVENYFLILVALEQNVKEHKRLRDSISGIVETIRGLNDEATVDMASTLSRSQGYYEVYDETVTTSTLDLGTVESKETPTLF